MQPFIGIGVGHEMTVKHPQVDRIGARLPPAPSQQACIVDAIPDDGPPSHQAQGNLTPEPSSETHAIFDALDGAAWRETEISQFRVMLLMIRDRREPSRQESMHHGRILDADTHRVTRESLRVGDEHLIRRSTEGRPERLDLRLCGTSASRV